MCSPSGHWSPPAAAWSDRPFSCSRQPRVKPRAPVRPVPDHHEGSTGLTAAIETLRVLIKEPDGAARLSEATPTIGSCRQGFWSNPRSSHDPRLPLFVAGPRLAAGSFAVASGLGPRLGQKIWNERREPKAKSQSPDRPRRRGETKAKATGEGRKRVWPSVRRWLEGGLEWPERRHDRSWPQSLIRMTQMQRSANPGPSFRSGCLGVARDPAQTWWHKGQTCLREEGLRCSPALLFEDGLVHRHRHRPPSHLSSSACRYSYPETEREILLEV